MCKVYSTFCSLNSLFLGLFSIKKKHNLFPSNRLSGQIDYSGQLYFSCGRRFFSRAFWGLRKGEDIWGSGPHRSSEGFTSQVLSQSGWFLKKIRQFWTGPALEQSWNGPKPVSMLSSSVLCKDTLIPFGHDCGFFLPS